MLSGLKRTLRKLVPFQFVCLEGWDEILKQTTHVEAYVVKLEDRGSIPRTSTIDTNPNRLPWDDGSDFFGSTSLRSNTFVFELRLACHIKKRRLSAEAHVIML